MTQIKPLPSQATPRFADIATFFRLPVVKDLNKLDYCVCGIPWDGGTTNRPGARHGPREIRNASSLVRTYHPSSLKSPYDKYQIADIGDFELDYLRPDLKHADEIAPQPQGVGQ